MGSVIFTVFGTVAPMAYYVAVLLFVGVFFGIYVPWNERKKKRGRQKPTPKAPAAKNSGRQSVPSFRPDAPDHMHITGAGLAPEKQLEQLDVLKNAGLLTDEEYDESRKEILREL